MSDNGKDIEKEIVKTPEQLAQERLERYQKDPDSFTENFDLVVATKRSPLGLLTLINQASRVELELSWARLNHGIHNAITSIEMAEYMKKKEVGLHIPEKHRILRFARGRK